MIQHQAPDFYRYLKETYSAALDVQIKTQELAQINHLVSEATHGVPAARLPTSQRRRARFPRWATGEALFHRRRWEMRRWRQLPVARDRGETAERVPQPPFLRVFRLTVLTVAHRGDLKRLWEKAVANDAYKGKDALDHYHNMNQQKVHIKKRLLQQLHIHTEQSYCEVETRSLASNYIAT